MAGALQPIAMRRYNNKSEFQINRKIATWKIQKENKVGNSKTVYFFKKSALKRVANEFENQPENVWRRQPTIQKPRNSRNSNEFSFESRIHKNVQAFNIAHNLYKVFNSHRKTSKNLKERVELSNSNPGKNSWKCQKVLEYIF